ncbi:MAG: chemotaxis protein CheD [Nitrospinae bacterium]|nr:chemotaxis protein CheD [Nitrospinota bacterium]
MGALDKLKMIVGISDMKYSMDPNSSLVTYSLGSCVGVVAYDPIKFIGGMLHYQLPSSNGHQERAKKNPLMFADLAIPLLLEGMRKEGASLGHVIIGIYGGAKVLMDGDLFKIGTQNVRVAKKILWQQRLHISNEDVGGDKGRTVHLDIETGKVKVHSDGKITVFE